MKKILSITISLCLVICSFVPVFAMDDVQLYYFRNQSGTGDANVDAGRWALDVLSNITSIYSRLNTTNARLNSILSALTDNSNSYILTNMLTQIQKLTHIADQLDFFLGSDGTTTITQNWSEFTADMYKLVRFLAPVGNNVPGNGNSFMTVWDYIFYEAGMINQMWATWDYDFSHLPVLPSFMNANHEDLSRLIQAETNQRWTSSYELTTNDRKYNSHYTLIDENGRYNLIQVNSDGTLTTTDVNWKNGTPLGNIALINRYGNGSIARLLSQGVAYYNPLLGIWDSQGETLTQEAWTPTSAINGLYKYLAYTQRDVARLTYVLASDEEIATREKARDTQTAVMDDFVDPSGEGAASVDDFGSISDASSGVQSNFNTGVSAGGVWNVFERNYEWFSQETANNLAYQPQRSTRNLKAAPDQEYDTPYLDSYYEELHDIIGF